MIFKKYLLVFVATFFVCTSISFSTVPSGSNESGNITTQENGIDNRNIQGNNSESERIMNRIRRAREKINRINEQNRSRIDPNKKLQINKEFNRQLEEHILGKKIIM